MIEIKIEETAPTKPETKPQRWQPKYFIKGKNSSDPAKKMRNQIVDMIYIRFLRTVKELYSRLPDSSERLVCDRDRKSDRSCPEAIWNFATSTFRMNLSCDVLSEFWIEYDFNNCPFEKEIMDLFNDGGLIRYMKRLKSPDYDAYFNNLINSYPEHIYTLKPTQS